MKIEFKKQLIYWANIILLTVKCHFFHFPVSGRQR